MALEASIARLGYYTPADKTVRRLREYSKNHINSNNNNTGVNLDTNNNTNINTKIDKNPDSEIARKKAAQRIKSFKTHNLTLEEKERFRRAR